MSDATEAVARRSTPDARSSRAPASRRTTWRRRGAARARLLALLVALPLAGCARNPVTGQRELALISEEQEIAMGQQAAQEVEASLGLVEDAELQRYVQEVGARLAAGSQRPNLPWRFRVVEDPTPNAFALPGGFIYLTRGMMSFMENEAELASVLGHEIGHVTARHTVQQMSRQQLAQLGLGIGAILSPTIAEFGGAISGGLQLLFLKYGRDDERQSDDLGFDYALQAGYDVSEMDDVFAVLERIGESQGQSPVPAWASTHPDPGERVQAAQQRVAALQQPTGQLRTDRAEYLQQIEGLVFGDDPRDGFFQSGRFIHPELRFVLGLPQGWKAQNTPQAVVAMSPQQDAAIQLTLAPGASPQSAAQQFLSQQGLQAGQPFSATVNGVPAVASYFAAATEQGTIQGLVAFFGYEGRTYQVMGFAPEGRFSQHDATFRQVLGSFGPLTDPALLAVQPNRLRVVRLSAPTSIAELARQYPAAPAELLAILNQAPGTGSTVPAGSTVKVVAR